MRISARIAAVLLASGLLAVPWTLGAQAQSSQLGCVFEPASGGRQVLRCARGVTITAEAGAQSLVCVPTIKFRSQNLTF